MGPRLHQQGASASSFPRAAPPPSPAARHPDPAVSPSSSQRQGQLAPWGQPRQVPPQIPDLPLALQAPRARALAVLRAWAQGPSAPLSREAQAWTLALSEATWAPAFVPALGQVLGPEQGQAQARPASISGPSQARQRP